MKSSVIIVYEAVVVVQLSIVSCRMPAAMWASRSCPSSADKSGCTYDSRKWHVPGMCSGNPTGRHDRLLSSNENPDEFFVKSLREQIKHIKFEEQYVCSIYI